MPVRLILLHELRKEDSAWLEAALSATDLAQHEVNLAACQERLGSSRWIPADVHADVLRSNDLDWLVRYIGLDDIARVLIIVRAIETAQAPRSLAEEWYVRAATPMRQLILRALPLCPQPKRHLQLALLASMSTDRRVCEAICLDNPYPAQFFSDLSFQQAIERVAWFGLPLERVRRLDGRMTPRLETALHNLGAAIRRP